MGVLFLLNALIIRFVTVRSASMFATLRPGDLLLVQRWTTWTGIHRGDIVVFRDPLKDSEPRWRRPLMVKRVAGTPGDILELRNARLFVNGTQADQPEGMTLSHLVRLRSGVDASALAQRHGLPDALIVPGRSNLETALNAPLADALVKDGSVVSVAPMRLDSGGKRHLFPFSPFYPWNGDDYGPITVPKRGDRLRITVDNLPLYDRLISVYEGHRLSNSGNVLLIDGQPLTTYEVEKDYYFVLGDSRHFSADSRYWGFVPNDHLIGRAVLLHRR
ncbi:MAG: signal peptidase I [Flavobacteriales bacterium]|nr:signal peptidase I [Flavobacteriales bacterium]